MVKFLIFFNCLLTIQSCKMLLVNYINYNVYLYVRIGFKTLVNHVNLYWVTFKKKIQNGTFPVLYK